MAVLNSEGAKDGLMSYEWDERRQTFDGPAGCTSVWESAGFLAKSRKNDLRNKSQVKAKGKTAMEKSANAKDYYRTTTARQFLPDSRIT